MRFARFVLDAAHAAELDAHVELLAEGVAVVARLAGARLGAQVVVAVIHSELAEHLHHAARRAAPDDATIFHPAFLPRDVVGSADRRAGGARAAEDDEGDHRQDAIARSGQVDVRNRDVLPAAAAADVFDALPRGVFVAGVLVDILASRMIRQNADVYSTREPKSHDF